MTNVLLNYYNFHEDWARGVLERLLRGKCVTVAPLSFRDGEVYDGDAWQRYYGKGGEKYVNILPPFLSYGIAEEDVGWIDYFTDDTESAQKKIRDADVLLFCGGLPEKTTQRLAQMRLTEAVKGFGGVLLGVSAGAMFQLDKYHVTPDADYPAFFFDEGIGLLSGFDIEVHFENTPLQRACIARAKRATGRDVYALWHQGGLLVEKGVVTPFGKVEKF